MIKQLSTLMIATVSVMAVMAPAAEAPDADAIVRHATQAAYYMGDDGRTEARMRILDADGRELRRQFTVLRRDVTDGGDQQFLVVFSQPADVRGTTFLVHKHAGGDDDRWLYLPALDLVKRIAPGDKRTSFVGSHYYYEDVSGRRPEDDVHELLGHEDGRYLLRHSPRDPTTVEFAHYRTWIDAETWIPMKIEYYDQAGQPMRRVEVLEVSEIQGIPTVVASRISDLISGGHTDMQFRYVAYDVGLPEAVFSERALRNPPRQWLQRPGQD